MGVCQITLGGEVSQCVGVAQRQESVGREEVKGIPRGWNAEQRWAVVGNEHGSHMVGLDSVARIVGSHGGSASGDDVVPFTWEDPPVAVWQMSGHAGASLRMCALGEGSHIRGLYRRVGLVWVVYEGLQVVSLKH